MLQQNAALQGLQGAALACFIQQIRPTSRALCKLWSHVSAAGLCLILSKCGGWSSQHYSIMSRWDRHRKHVIIHACSRTYLAHHELESAVIIINIIIIVIVVIIIIMHAAAGGSVDIQSVTEASLRIASCSGAVKLGKIKASSADVNTEGSISPIAFMSMFLSTSLFLCKP